MYYIYTQPKLLQVGDFNFKNLQFIIVINTAGFTRHLLFFFQC